ncbi:efflux RND transporter periplasmic adaptor subunit [Neisseriaceae bacterium TC5R-5]|nr:efflux RND transporter periplasmic adaptor subunit [Neisseriaceae bacterium TC5R-5]
MKKHGIAVGFSLLFLTACNPQGSNNKPPAVTQARILSTTDVIKTQAQPFTASLAFTGSLNALSSSSVAAEVEARVKEVKVREGESVKRGQLLAILDAEVLAQSVAEQDAQVANSMSRLRLAKVKLEKQKELLAQGFISQMAYDELESDYRVRAGEAKAQATQLSRAKRLLADTQVRAPIDGVVYQRKINPGEVAAKNSVLFAIADLSILEIAAQVPANAVAQIRPGMPAMFTIDGLDTPQHGEVVRINPVAVTGTRSFTLYIRVKNPAGILKVGQFAKGQIALQRLDSAITVPLQAIQDAATQPWVWVVQQGKLVRRPVVMRLRAESEGKVAIEGVAAGEWVIALALPGVKAGDAMTLPTAKS